ncbi:MAG TPA: immunoglobulin domain-containing protein [Verrucomicrobiae bacterium]|nr:immunoglobulin domain-containing protein [Verrucomicrobiae bacterium]
MKLLARLLIQVVSGLLFLQVSQAQLLVEHFDYNNGSLGGAGVGSTVWTAGDSPSVALIVTNAAALTNASLSGITGKGLQYNGGTFKKRAASFTAQTTGTVYVSFLLSIQTAPSTAKAFVYLHNSTSATSSPELGIFLNGNNIGIGKGVSSPAVSTALSAGTHLIVASYTFQSGADLVALWVDPTSLGNNSSVPSATISTTAGSDGSSLSTIFLNHAAAQTVYLDELRVGTSWADVTPTSTAPVVSGPPVITQAFMDPTGFVVSGTNGTPSGTYYVITSANMAATVSNWFCIATNQFDSLGNFACTNPVSPADMVRFYRIWFGSPGPVNPTPPSISSQPLGLSVLQGQSASFTVVATGTMPLSYQWYYNLSTAIGGGIGATLTITNVQLSDAGSYSVIVANSAGSATSSVATLTVSVPVPPSIVTQPQDLTVGEGDTASFNVGANGTAPLSYQWYYNTNTPVGSGGATLTLSGVSTDDAGGYSVIVANGYGSITSVVATLTVTNVLAAPSISTQPQSQTVTEGQGAAFSVTANGTPPLTYQWYFNTNSPMANATNSTLSVDNVSSNDAGVYSVLVANDYGSITSAFATLTVNPAPTNGGPVQILQAEDGTFTGTVANNHSGYTGTGFVDTDNAVGSYIAVEFGRQHAGTETMYIRYAHGKTDDRPASVMVNGATVTSSLAFPATGDYTNWQYVTNAIPVVAGRNVVQITALNSGGLVNVDRFEITGDPQYKLNVSVVGGGIVSLNPSNAFNYYNPGTPVQLTGVPVTGSVFAAWSGDLVSSNNPDTLIVNSNESVTATFNAFLHFPLYVSPTGSDSNPGTIDQPFYSLQKAVDAAIPGDTINVRGGTFTYAATVLIDKPATSNSPISIVAYSGEHPVLDYSTWHPASEDIRSGARGIRITTNAQYWVLEGLQIQFAPDNGVKCEGGHITFDRCIFNDNGDTGLQIGLNKDTLSSNPDPEHFAAYVYVLNCDAYHNNDPATGYENADGIDCKLYAGKGNRLYGCRSWDNCDDGYDCYQTDYEIVFQNCWSWHNGDPSLFGNPSSFSGDGNGFKLGGDSTYCPMLVENCVALNCQWGTTVGFAYNDNTAPITLYNCAALNCGRSYNMQQAGNIFANCLDYNATRPAPKDISSSSTMQNCSWTLGITVTAGDFISMAEADAAAARQADGSLPNNGFGRLAAGSDLIDKGVDIGLPYCGSAPDLGAYEYCP